MVCCGGRYKTRTCDLPHVKRMRYQLRQSSIYRHGLLYPIPINLSIVFYIFLSSDINHAGGGLAVAGQGDGRRARGNALDGAVLGDSGDALVAYRPLVIGCYRQREVRAGQSDRVADMAGEVRAYGVSCVGDLKLGYLGRGRRCRGRRRRGGRNGGHLGRRGRHDRRIGIVGVLEADAYHDYKGDDDRSYQNSSEHELPLSVFISRPVGGSTLNGAGGGAGGTAAAFNSAGAAGGAAVAHAGELRAAAAAGDLRNKTHISSSFVKIHNNNTAFGALRQAESRSGRTMWQGDLNFFGKYRKI